jgi:chromosome segregation ATPase
MEHPFRSAAIGGFNKQDVLDFLEAQAKQTAQAQQELQGRLEESERQGESLRRELDEANRQLEAVRRALEEADQAREELAGQLERANEAASDSRQEASRLAGELRQARRERDEMRAQRDAVWPDAQAYIELKERTAGVELEAHRRAQAIQAKAEEDAQKARRQVEQWLKRMGREYDALCTQVETTVSHAASELEKAGAGLERLNELMSGQGTALEGVRRAYDETNLGRPEAPMPIDET